MIVLVFDKKKGIYYFFILFKCFYLDKLFSLLNVLFYFYKLKKFVNLKLDYRVDINGRYK